MGKVPVLLPALVWLWGAGSRTYRKGWGHLPPTAESRDGAGGHCKLVFSSSYPHLPPLSPAQAVKTEKPLAPALALAELGSILPVANSTSAELPSDLGMCQAFLSNAAAQPEPPPPASRTTTSTGSPGSGKAGRQLAAGRLLPAGATTGLIQLGLLCLTPQAAWCRSR